MDTTDTTTATYTWDIFTTLDGFGSYDDPADWGGYWSKDGPEFTARRQALYSGDIRMVFGATTFREFQEMIAPSVVADADLDPINLRIRQAPLTVVSSTITDASDWPDATVVSGDAVDVVARLKETSTVPLISHGSLSLNHALMAAGLVDEVRVTLFPVISGRTGVAPILSGADDFDLELIEAVTLDGHTQQLAYRPNLRTWS